MSAEITLAVGASAEHDTCGSCKFFRRRMNDGPYAMSYGECGFELPKTVATQRNLRYFDPKQRDADFTGNEDQIKDTDRCDLWQWDRKVYIVQRRVGASPP